MEINYQNRRQAVEDIYERDKGLLLENYKTGVSSLDKNKTAAEEMAAVTRERMLKYLPQQMRAQGINTQGVSEDALIKAHNNYQNTMADITANYDTQKSTLESEKSRGEVELADKRDSAILEIERENNAAYEELLAAVNNGDYKGDEVYDLAVKRGLSEADAKKLSLSARMKEAEADGVVTETEYNELKEYLDTGKERLGGDAYAQLIDSLKKYEEDVKKDNEPDFSKVSTRDERDGVSGEYKTNEEFRVEIGENSYDLTTGSQMSESYNANLTQRYKDNNGGAAPSVGSMIADDGFLKIYLRNENGGYSWFAVRKNDNEYSDFVTAMGLAGTEYETHKESAYIPKQKSEEQKAIEEKIQEALKPENQKAIGEKMKEDVTDATLGYLSSLLKPYY